MGWTLKLEDVEVTDLTVTAGEAQIVEAATRIPWAAFDPFAAVSNLAQLVVAVLVCRKQMDLDAAVDLVGTKPVPELLAAIQTR